eukprot:gene10442-2573_t
MKNQGLRKEITTWSNCKKRFGSGSGSGSRFVFRYDSNSGLSGGLWALGSGIDLEKDSSSNQNIVDVITKFIHELYT